MESKRIFVCGLITVVFVLAFTVLSLTGCDTGAGGKPEPAHTHDWDWVVTTPATTEAEGLETETCKTCGETRGTKPIAKLPPEHTHDYDTAWKSNATQHWRECSCGDKTDVADHEWEWKETKQATPTADGLETETCKTCGETRGTRIIAKLPNPNKSTITAFGKTANVTGDASIPSGDFNTAKGNLESALAWADSLGDDITSEERDGFAVIMSRTITIVTGNAEPVSLDGALTVGVDYLKSSTQKIIVNAILDLIQDNAFAMVITPAQGKVQVASSVGASGRHLAALGGSRGDCHRVS